MKRDVTSKLGAKPKKASTQSPSALDLTKDKKQKKKKKEKQISPISSRTRKKEHNLKADHTGTEGDETDGASKTQEDKDDLGK